MQTGQFAGRQMASAIAWTAAGKWASQIFAWASTLIVVRLLSPKDFGLIGLAMTYLGLIGLLSEFGIGTAIVTLRTLSDRQIAQLHTASILLGVAGTVMSAAVSIPLSHFFRAPELAALVPVMGISFLVASFRSVPYALLQKDLQFHTLSWMDAVQALVQAFLSAVLVWLGFRYWAIAISGIAGSLVAAVLVYQRRPVAVVRPAFHSIYDSIVFSWRILVSRLSWYLYSNSDFVVAGRVLGTNALGVYTVAWNFANLPGEKIVALVTSVTPTFFASVQNNKAAMRQYLALLTEVLAVVMFPVVCGFALLAPDFVPLALGVQWKAAVVPLQMLAIYTFVRAVVALLPQVINVVGATRFGMWHSLCTLVVLPTCFSIGSRWGVIGIAGVWVALYPLIAVPLYWKALTAIEMRVSEYVDALKPALVSTAVMFGSVVALQRVLPAGFWVPLKLGAEAGFGAAIYVGTMFAFFRSHVGRYVEFAKRLRSGS